MRPIPLELPQDQTDAFAAHLPDSPLLAHCAHSACDSLTGFTARSRPLSKARSGSGAANQIAPLPQNIFNKYRTSLGARQEIGPVPIRRPNCSRCVAVTRDGAQANRRMPDDLLERLTKALARAPGVAALALGGSRAGERRPVLGLRRRPLLPEGRRAEGQPAARHSGCARRRPANATVTETGEWGPSDRRRAWLKSTGRGRYPLSLH